MLYLSLFKWSFQIWIPQIVQVFCSVHKEAYMYGLKLLHRIFWKCILFVLNTLYVFIDISQCGNYGNLLSHIFGKNFVKVTFLLKSWFDEIFFGESKFFNFPQCAELQKFTLTHFWQKFRESNVFTKELLKNWFDEIFFRWD